MKSCFIERESSEVGLWPVLFNKGDMKYRMDDI